MKKVCAVLLMIAGMGAVAYGHPASEVAIANDGEILTITAVHGTRDAAIHYIDNVAIDVNGKKAIIQHCTRQTSSTAQTLTYVVPGLKTGDSIRAAANCNKGGYKTATTKAQ